MRPRKELDDKLRQFLDDHNIPKTSDGKYHLYFQPTSNTKLAYPCIIYSIEDKPEWRANNKIYNLTNRYSVTYISKSSEDQTVNDLLEDFFYCSFDRRYVTDNLYHTVFSIYF